VQGKFNDLPESNHKYTHEKKSTIGADRVPWKMEDLINLPSQVIISSQTRDTTLRAVCLSFLKIIPFRVSQIRQRIARRIEGQTAGSKLGIDGDDQISTLSMLETEERLMQSQIS